MTNAAIVQLASFGDAVISTLIPAAIKQQRPDWHITYYIIEECAGAVQNNPHIDKLMILPGNKDRAWAIQAQVISEARAKHEKVITPWAGHYPQDQWVPLDRPGLPWNFMWAYVRTAQLLGLDINTPPTIYLFPTDREKTKARNFITSLPGGRKRVLMETEGHSSQSWLNQSWIAPIMDVLSGKYGSDVELLISKGGSETPEIAVAKQRWPGRVHLLNHMSLREVSCLFNDCDVFIGCSSGTSNICHTHLCKREIQWFESVKTTLWDSTPLRPDNKNIFYGEDPHGFFTMIREKLL